MVDRFSLYYFGFSNFSQVLRLQVCTTAPGPVFSVSYGMSCLGHHNKLCFEFLFLGFVFGMYLCVCASVQFLLVSLRNTDVS